MPPGASRGKGSANGGGKAGKGGGGKGGGAAGDGPNWDCHICGLPANFGWRLRCRGCEAIKRGKWATGVAAATSDANRGSQPQQQSLAERQIKQLREEQRRQRLADEEEKKQLREALARMRVEAAGRKGKAPEDDDGGDDELEGEEMDTSASKYASWTEEERQRKLDEAKGGLAYLISEYGEDSAEANNTREKISAIQRASRDAKPFKAHRSLLERKRERLKEKQTRDEAEVAKITDEIEALEAKRKDLRSAVADRGKQITQIEEELAELVRRALAEGDAAGEAGRLDGDGTTPWSAQAASATLQALAAKPGVPPEFAALLAHVFQAAQALANAAASTGPAASSTAAERSESSNHRGDQQQQQQPPQQKQPPHPAAATEAGAKLGAGTAEASAAAGSKGGLSSAVHAPLAPQGRWARGTGSGAGDSGGKMEGDGMQVDAEGANGNQATAGATGNQADSEAELVEEEALGSGIDEGVTESISKLPAADQEKLRAALGARGGRRSLAKGEQGRGAAEGRDRERSPRPTTKGAGSQNEQ